MATLLFRKPAVHVSSVRDDGVRRTLDGKTLMITDGSHGMGNVQTTTWSCRKAAGHSSSISKMSGLRAVWAWSGPGFASESGRRRPTTPKRWTSPSDSPRRLHDFGPEKVRGWEAAGVRAQREPRGGQDAEERQGPVRDRGQARGAPERFVLFARQPAVKGTKSARRFPTSFNCRRRAARPAPGGRPLGRRTCFAIGASPDNALTARVIVNRLSAAYFGGHRPASAERFGTQGIRRRIPSLASIGWRGIRSAKAWRMKAFAPADSEPRSLPDVAARNAKFQTRSHERLFGARHARLKGEEIRDSILAVTATSSQDVRPKRLLPRFPWKCSKANDAGPRWSKSSARKRRGGALHPP